MFAKHLLARDSKPPVAGEKLTGELGKEVAWAPSRAQESGELEGGAGWAYAAVESASARVAIAELSGASTLFVNGTAFVGDVYRYGFRGVPVALREGRNDVYVTGIRGGFSLRLREPAGPLVAGAWDATLPDSASGEGAILVMNATERAVELSSPSKFHLAPLQATKVPFAFDLGKLEIGAHALPVEVAAKGSDAKATESLQVELRAAPEARRVTFRSGIDGSVQYYAVLPPAAKEPPEWGFGLVLTLHGASVDALGQARSYSAKEDFWIVAPTNRRPFGFDWQDWGRLDAYEALDRALALSGVADERVYLTGHSMGGHGTWHLGANDPDRFAAIAPSAGWISFDTYGGRPKGTLADLWQRADGASRTLDLLSNLRRAPIYVLHGSADDNVPVSEARDVVAAMPEDMKRRMALHVQEGAGHWWDGDASPGADCVDWPALFEMFRRHLRSQGDSPPQPRREVDWISVDPSVDARDSWVEVAQPVEYGRPFRVRGSYGLNATHVQTVVNLTTENVRRLRIDATGLQNLAKRFLDDAAVDPSTTGWYLLTERGWKPDAEGPPASEKSPTSSGPFKRAFDRRFVLVPGTNGDDVEDRELLDLARYTAECWWYRGNGTASILTDAEFLSRKLRHDGNLILFGNEDTNAAWKVVLPDRCPVRARRGSIELRGEKHEGDGLACLFVYPRADAPALVGAFADSGPKGTRLLTTIPVFVSGVGLPDFTLFGPEVLERGDDGVLTAGWFDFAWK
ncbi:MAG: prolyl oligopeptidase family serine peptidase [Planctomycetota bacterium]